MSNIFALVFFLFSMQISHLTSYYIKPIVANSMRKSLSVLINEGHKLLESCRCGLIVPESSCDSVFHSPEMQCGLMTVSYGFATYPECSRVYITCIKQGAQFQSVGIVAKVVNKFTK